MTEIHVYQTRADQTVSRTIYSGECSTVPVVGDILGWDDKKFSESSEPKLWHVIEREIHHVKDIDGMLDDQYVDLFVVPYLVGST